jgi:hypothetical protein
MPAAKVPFEVPVLLTRLIFRVEVTVLLQSSGVLVEFVSNTTVFAFAKGSVKVDR